MQGPCRVGDSIGAHLMAGQPKTRGVQKRPPALGARGYSWLPLQPGHELSLRHGVWSARKIDPIALGLAAGVVADRPDLKPYPEAVMAWARAEARCMLADDYIVEHGLLDADGEPRGVLSHLVRFENLAARLRERLGLDPLSEPQLARERAEATVAVVDLDEMHRRGRAALDARVVATDDSAGTVDEESRS